LRWRNFVSNEIYGNTSINNTIRFAWDLPDCELRERLEPILEMRALLPLLRMNCKVHGLIVLNKEKKTVARLGIEENRILGSTKSKPHKLPAILNVESVKGYDTVFKEVLQVINQQLLLKLMIKVWYKGQWQQLITAWCVFFQFEFKAESGDTYRGGVAQHFVAPA